MTKLLGLLCTLAFVLAVPAAPAQAGDPIEPFVGEWKGVGITDGLASAAGFADRNLDLKIEKSARGFRITWNSIQEHRDDRSHRMTARATSVGFSPAGKEGLYVMDAAKAPLTEHAYLWAQVADRILTVHSIMLSDDGHLEHQKYVRTLQANGDLQLLYTRRLDDDVARTVMSVFRRR
jgi:hypothetical protein